MTLLVTSDHHPISRRMGQATGYKNGLKLETWSTFQWFQRFHKSRFYQVPQAGQKVSILNFVVWSEISPKTSCRSRSMVMRVQLQMASHSRCPRIKILSACGLADHQKREPSKKTTGWPLQNWISTKTAIQKQMFIIDQCWHITERNKLQGYSYARSAVPTVPSSWASSTNHQFVPGSITKSLALLYFIILPSFIMISLCLDGENHPKMVVEWWLVSP